MTDFAAYMLCTAPRSGSTLLCKLLAATGVAGRPESYFYGRSLEAWAETTEEPVDTTLPARDRVAAFFRAAQREGSGGSGLFGLRQQIRSFAFLREMLAVLHPDAPSDCARLERAFGPMAFIHLSRADKLAQAVSLLKAEQSGLWHVAPDGAELERSAPHREPVYDGAALGACIAMLEGYERAWEDWFAREGVTPLRISYDELSADPLAVLRRALDHLGKDSSAADGVMPGVKKLADGTSDDWIARYRAEHLAG